MKKLLRNMALSGIVFSMLLLPSCVTTSSKGELQEESSYQSTVDKVKKFAPLIKTDLYETVEIKEEKDFLTTNISYPTFENYPSLDKYISNLIESGWENFKIGAEKSWKETAELNSYSLPPYEYNVSFNVTNTQNIISIYFEIYSFEGGAHGQTRVQTVNFETKTGKYLTVTQATGYSYEELRDECNKALYKTLIRDQRFEIDGETVSILDEMREEGTKAIAGNYEAFTITDKELTVYFEPAKVAPHYYGIQTVTIPLK